MIATMTQELSRYYLWRWPDLAELLSRNTIWLTAQGVASSCKCCD